jgi:hypothetical protein
VGAYNEIYKDIPENIKEFFESTKYSKMTESNIQDWNELHDPNYAAFTDTYLNIITESTYFHSFYTEKTAKPLVSEQLFVMVGGSKSISNLKELGFNCFDPLIDSGYDSIENWIERVDCVLKVLDTIYFDNEDIYFHYQKERKYNKEYFLSDSFRNKCLDQVRDLLK